MSHIKAEADTEISRTFMKAVNRIQWLTDHAKKEFYRLAADEKVEDCDPYLKERVTIFEIYEGRTRFFYIWNSLSANRIVKRIEKALEAAVASNKLIFNKKEIIALEKKLVKQMRYSTANQARVNPAPYFIRFGSVSLHSGCTRDLMIRALEYVSLRESQNKKDKKNGPALSAI